MTGGGVLFFGMAKILSQVLLSYGHVLLPGSMDALDNIVVGLAFLALASSYGIYGLAIGVVIGCAAQLLFQLPILWQKRDMYSAQLNLFHPAMREMAKLALPALFATSGKQVAKITDRIFASMLPAGSLSALSYANGLMAVVKELFVEAPDQAIFPHLTKLSAERKFQDLSRQLFNYVRIVFFITLPIGIGAMVLAEPIVRLVYHRGAFDEASVLTTSQALMFYSIGFPAYGLTNILSRTFFGMKDTWTPTKVAFLRHGSRIALAWVLIQWIGHAGIALADSLSSVVSGVCLFLYLPAEIKGDEGWKTVKSFGQTIGATALMLGVVYFAKERWIEILSGPIGVFALIVLGGAIYAVAAVLTRRKDMDIVVHGLTGLLPNALTRKP
jgi:putative peptidoglycan lipid II flippase